MSDHAPSRLWVMRMYFAALVLAMLFFHLLPLQTATGGLIWPDFILCFALAWSVRRPDYVPFALLAALFLLADFLLQRPPGLWAVLALMACAQMQMRARLLRDATLAAEFASVAACIVGVGLGYRIILGLFLIDMPALGPFVIQMGVTILAYPLVVALTHGLMRVRKLQPGDFEIGGTRV